MRRFALTMVGGILLIGTVGGLSMIESAWPPALPFAAAAQQLSQLSERSGPQSVPSPAKEGTPATVIDDQDVDGILGKNVRSVAGEDMGRMVDILVSKGGQVRAVVIDFGGFLGVGSRKIAVDWAALRFPESGKLDRMTVDLTRDQVRLAPEYRPGAPIVVLGGQSSAPQGPTTLAPTSEK